MTDHAKELEELEELLADPGWARVEAHALREWGPEAYRRRMGQLLAGLPAETDPRSYVLQVEASAREVERLIAWPRERVAKLRGQQAATVERASNTWPRQLA